MSRINIDCCDFAIQAFTDIGDLSNKVLEYILFDNVNLISSSMLRFFDVIEMKKIMHNGALRRMDFIDANFLVHNDIQNIITTLHNILSIIVPQSPKAIELSKRMKTEITLQQRKKLSCYQIENLENEIKNEIEFKYNQIDVNELNEISNTDSKHNKCTSRYNWCTNIEMLTLGPSRSDNLLGHDTMPNIEEIITPQRVKTAYAKLKAFAMYEQFYEKDIFCVLSQIILNHLCYQLESL